jgi:glycosyltransferase involved in cell wall biosynthesis
MALGTPVIATQKGAEGLLVKNGDNILLADSPQDFAAAVIRALDDADLRNRLALAGRQLVETQYNWDAIGCQLAQFIEEIIEKR